MKRFLILGLPCVALLLTFSFACSRDSEKTNSIRNVVLATVEPLSKEVSTIYSGVVEEGSSINASFMADGKINRLAVKEGDRVRKGQLIATLDDSDYRIGVSQLEDQYNQMTKEKERMDAMFEKHNIAPNDYEKFETGYQQLKLQLEMGRRKLSYTRLNSPSDGYIATRYMNEGELVGAGTPVYNIIDDTNLYAIVDLPVSTYLNKDKIKGAKGSVPGIAGDFPLTVISFTPDVDNNMLYRMKLSIPASIAKELTPGMNISVSLESTENVMSEAMIPSRAIFAERGNYYVWSFNTQDSTIHRKAVTIEGSPSDHMSVVKGLDNGEKVVETGVRQLYEGEKVNVLNRKDIGL